MNRSPMPSTPPVMPAQRPRRDFHFVFGLKPQDEPLHLAFYLALESCRRVNQPDAMHFHYRNEPWGPYWERIKPYLTLHRVGGAGANDSGLDVRRYNASGEGRFIRAQGIDYAHEADVIRLRALLEGGGCYADMDTLFVRPYPDDCFSAEFAMAEEGGYQSASGVLRPSLCNAVMFARPGAAFVRQWLEEMPMRFDGSWSAHSCQAAGALAFAMPERVRVLPWAWFYRYGATVSGIASLFGEDGVPLRHDQFSFHLWAHLWWSSQRTDFSLFHAGLLTEDWVRQSQSTYAQMARQFLPER